MATFALTSDNGRTVETFQVETTGDMLATLNALYSLALSVEATADRPEVAMPTLEQAYSVLVDGLNGEESSAYALGHTFAYVAPVPEPVAAPEETPEPAAEQQQDTEGLQDLRRDFDSLRSLVERVAARFGVSL